jgi:hypothetical protein
MKKNILFTVMLLEGITLPACSKKAQKTLKEVVRGDSSIETSNKEKEEEFEGVPLERNKSSSSLLEEYSPLIPCI